MKKKELMHATFSSSFEAICSSSPLPVKQNNQVTDVFELQDSQAFFTLLASENNGIISTGFRKMLACLPKCDCLKTIVSFGDISCTQKKEADDDAGLSCFTWEEFAQLGIADGEFPVKQKSNICTIM
ncbi:putative CoA ligase CCL6 [Silene latifolia]|uniref:putative CoA ligase CCL6 n=1 Tax=Silene latifolia TaxID=37657 RepID=UPI003D787167